VQAAVGRCATSSDLERRPPGKDRWLLQRKRGRSVGNVLSSRCFHASPRWAGGASCIHRRRPGGASEKSVTASAPRGYSSTPPLPEQTAAALHRHMLSRRGSRTAISAISTIAWRLSAAITTVVTELGPPFTAGTPLQARRSFRPALRQICTVFDVSFPRRIVVSAIQTHVGDHNKAGGLHPPLIPPAPKRHCPVGKSGTCPSPAASIAPLPYGFGTEFVRPLRGGGLRRKRVRQWLYIPPRPQLPPEAAQKHVSSNPSSRFIDYNGLEAFSSAGRV